MLRSFKESSDCLGPPLFPSCLPSTACPAPAPPSQGSAAPLCSCVSPTHATQEGKVSQSGLFCLCPSLCLLASLPVSPSLSVGQSLLPFVFLSVLLSQFFSLTLKKCVIFLSSHLYYSPSLISSFDSLITKVSLGPNSASCLRCRVCLTPCFWLSLATDPGSYPPAPHPIGSVQLFSPGWAAGSFFWTSCTRPEFFVQSMAICSCP